MLLEGGVDVYRRPKARRGTSEEGFTLIELMVVVLIIGILVAIALPTFLGARNRAHERAAQADLRNGFAAAKVWFTEAASYTGFSVTEAQSIEPAIQFNTLANAVADQVTIRQASGPNILLVTQSRNDVYFCIAGDTTNQAFGRDTTDSWLVEADCTGGW